MAATLRPLNTVELLDAALALVRRQPVLLLACSAVGSVPVVLLSVGYLYWLETLVEGTDAAFYPGTFAWASLMALAWGVNSLARGAVTAAALEEARGRRASWAGAWEAARSRAVDSAFLGLATFAAAALGGSCLVFPGVLVALAWWPARPVALDEERTGIAAMRRARRLGEGYRGRAFGLWLLLGLLWVVGVLDLYLAVQFLTGTASGFLGIDTSALQARLAFSSRSFFALLCCLLFLLLDPLKSVLDALYYLDLRTRREGADLQERLRALRTHLSAAVGIGLLAGATQPAHAIPYSDYARKVRDLETTLRTQGPEAARRAAESLRGQVVDLPGGRRLGVDPAWLKDFSAAAAAPTERARLLKRVEAVSRLVGAGSRGGGALDPAAGADPAPALRVLLQEPEFQPLAERGELKSLLKGVDLRRPSNWFQSFLDWLAKTLFRPNAPQAPEAPVRSMDLTVPAYVLLGLAVAFLLAMLVRWIQERPARRRPAAAEGPPASLDASATENALDHSARDWDRFAREWLSRGDVRQAVRALYLGTLSHLHRERLIDYNRALTNWVYVRQFAGGAEQRDLFRHLTALFDEVWYGDRDCGEEQFRRAEQAARALGAEV